MQAVSTAILRDVPPQLARGNTRAGVDPRHVTVCGFAEAAPAWAALQAVAPCSPYQQFAWSKAWCDTVGVARRQSPILAVVRDQTGRAVALFPFVREVICGVRIARFIGGKDSNANLALFGEPAAWTAEVLRAVLKDIGARSGVDVFILQNQPLDWRGQANPLALLPHQPSPSGVAATELRSERALSKQARKRLRQKTGWLEALGPVEFRRARTPDDIDRILDAYVAHRMGRAGTVGIAPPSQAQLAFYRRAADLTQAGGSSLDLYALWCGSEIVATFGGTGLRGQYSGMILSAATRSDVVRCSPGELLLRRLVDDLTRRAFQRFDLGIGEARYKASICDERDPLFDCILPVTSRGRIAALGIAIALRAKRRVKQSEFGMTLRRRLGGLAHRIRSGGLNRP